jgi:penicillin-binding protein 1A
MDNLDAARTARFADATYAGARSSDRVHQHYGAHRRHYAAYLLMRGARKRRQAAQRAHTQATWGGMAGLLLLIIGVLVFSVRAAVTYLQTEDPMLAALQHTVAARDSVRVYDSRGVLLFQFNRAGAQHSVPLAQVPSVVVNATIATEDHDFWSNQGVDFRAIARAAYTDATAGQIQEGASTITQQLIKQNVLTSDPTFTRKIQEVVLALGLTAQGTFSKAQILQMYLNSIPYGPTTYGIDAAATTYFSYTDNPNTGETAAQHLDLAQATMLAGIPKSPAYDDPLTGPDGFAHARARQLVVLVSMVQQGYVTQAQANAAWQEAGQPHFFHPQFTTPDLAPHFVDYIEQQLDQMVSAGQLHVAPGQDIARTGLDVYTTLDLDLQNHVQQYMLDHLCGTDLNDYPGSPNRYIRDDNVTNTAAVIADQHTGAIRVLLGSMDYYGNKTCHPGVNGQFDVATQGYRGPGSSFKPIDYATAFQMGWGPGTIVHNEPTTFWDPGSGAYKPHDADNHHLAANMTVRNALQLSQNIPAVETMQFAGIQNVEHNAELWGIQDWQGVWGLSSAIGSLDVHPIDMVQVYTVFANYGLYIPLHAIDRITDPAGNTMFQYQQPKPVRVLSQQAAFLLTSILSDNPSRIPEFNVCSPMYLDPSVGDCYDYHGNSPHVWPAAAKTGTGDDLTNDWTMGYTMDYTMGVWVGNNDFSPMQWVDGVTGAAPIWYHSMLYAERSLPQRAFPVPSGVRFGSVKSDGIRTTDWYITSQTPPNPGP